MEPGSALPMPKTVPTKPYDWTYTTVYSGSSGEGVPAEFMHADPENPLHAIPLAELTRPDPILFYAEIPLFEDELHDNGSSDLVIRIVNAGYMRFVTTRLTELFLQRVMPTCIFILSRFTLRVDNVLFRTFDTRIYHSFKSSPPLIVKETSGWEAPYNDVKRVCATPFPACLLLNTCLVPAWQERLNSSHGCKLHRKDVRVDTQNHLSGSRCWNRLASLGDFDGNCNS